MWGMLGQKRKQRKIGDYNYIHEYIALGWRFRSSKDLKNIGGIDPLVISWFLRLDMHNLKFKIKKNLYRCLKNLKA